MTQIPTQDQNPMGLHQRYNVSKADGSPVDPDAVYFVLRLDRNGDDGIHREACREAARAYASYVDSVDFPVEELRKVGRELVKLVDQL